MVGFRERITTLPGSRNLCRSRSHESQRTVDLLVIGGGVNGAGIARDAAGRGLSVMLCEQGDLAGATSSASSKLIHGGLRYLEYYKFRFVREALKEREVLLGIAPHIVWPARFVLPHDNGLRPAFMIEAGLFLYDWLAPRKRLRRSRRLDSARGLGRSAAQATFHDGLCLFRLPRGRCKAGGAERCRCQASAAPPSARERAAFPPGAKDALWHVTLLDCAYRDDDDRDGARARQCGGTLGRRCVRRCVGDMSQAKSSALCKEAISSCPGSTRASNAMSCKAKTAASSSSCPMKRSIRSSARPRSLLAAIPRRRGSARTKSPISVPAYRVTSATPLSPSDVVESFHGRAAALR